MLFDAKQYDYILVDYSAMFMNLDEDMINVLASSSKAIVSRTFDAECRQLNECVTYRLQQNYKKNTARLVVGRNLTIMPPKALRDTFGLVRELQRTYKLLVIEANYSLEDKLIYTGLHTDILSLMEQRLIRFATFPSEKMRTRLVRTKTPLTYFSVSRESTVYTRKGRIVLGEEKSEGAEAKIFAINGNSNNLAKIFIKDEDGQFVLTREKLENIRKLCELNAIWDVMWLALPIEIIYADEKMNYPIGYTMKYFSKTKFFNELSLFDNRSMINKFPEHSNVRVRDVLDYCLKFTRQVLFLSLNDIHISDFNEKNFAVSLFGGSCIMMVDTDSYCHEGYVSECMPASTRLSRHYECNTELDMIRICEESLAAFTFSLLLLDTTFDPMRKGQFRFTDEQLEKMKVNNPQRPAQWGAIPSNLQRFYTRLYGKTDEISVDILLYELDQAFESSFSSKLYKDLYKNVLPAAATGTSTDENNGTGTSGIKTGGTAGTYIGKGTQSGGKNSQGKKFLKYVVYAILIVTLLALIFSSAIPIFISKDKTDPDTDTSQTAAELIRYNIDDGYYLCENEELTGYCEYYANDGSIYRGEMTEGILNGEVVSIWSNGDTFTGNYENGLRQGTGTYIWANGDIYTGDFIEGARTGSGTYTWANGDVYTGELVNGELEGIGKLTWVDGSSYDGTFIAGSRSGEGTLYNSAGIAVYKGGFEDGLFNGSGTYYFPNDASFEAEWVAGTYQDKKEVDLIYTDTQESAAKGYWENNIFYGSYYQDSQWINMP